MFSQIYEPESVNKYAKYVNEKQTSVILWFLSWQQMLKNHKQIVAMWMQGFEFNFFL